MGLSGYEDVHCKKVLTNFSDEFASDWLWAVAMCGGADSWESLEGVPGGHELIHIDYG